MITKLESDEAINDCLEFNNIISSYKSEQVELKKRSRNGKELAKIKMYSKILEVSFILVFENEKSKFHASNLSFESFNKDYDLSIVKYLDSITEKPVPTVKPKQNIFKKLFIKL